QRQLSSVANIRDGQPTMIAGVSEMNKNDSRTTIPIIGLIPIFGRLFTIPDTGRDDTDIVIMVTPHILRAPVFTKEDHEAIPSGSATSSDRQIAIEEIIYRAQLEEQAAEQAPIAKTPAAPPRPSTSEMEVGPQQPGSPTRTVKAGTGE